MDKIEQLKNDIKNIIDNNTWIPSKLARLLIEKGYHKTIWHKVADGDIPKHIGDIIMAIKSNDHIITTTGRYRLYDFYISDIGRIEKEKVIAWAEIPEYKGD